jgi:hypothetical protein
MFENLFQSKKLKSRDKQSPVMNMLTFERGFGPGYCSAAASYIRVLIKRGVIDSPHQLFNGRRPLDPIAERELLPTLTIVIKWNKWLKLCSTTRFAKRTKILKLNQRCRLELSRGPEVPCLFTAER